MYRLILTLLFITLLSQSCKLDPPTYYIASNASPYYPVTIGSTWKYVLEYPDNLPDTSLHIVSGDTKIINKLVYRTLFSISKAFGNTNDYVHNDNHLIDTRTKLTVIGATVNMRILNDTLAVGGKWIFPTTDDGILKGLPSRLLGTIIEKGITKTVNGKTFAEVIHSEVELQVDKGNGFLTETTYDFYIAKNVGVILTEATSGNQKSVSRLIDYDIKP